MNGYAAYCYGIYQWNNGANDANLQLEFCLLFRIYEGCRTATMDKSDEMRQQAMIAAHDEQYDVHTSF